MECYQVQVNDKWSLCGFTAAGRRVRIPPGEYHVHHLVPKVPVGTTLRFVGAGSGDDVHVPLPDGIDIRQALALALDQEGACSASSIRPLTFHSQWQPNRT